MQPTALALILALAWPVAASALETRCAAIDGDTIACGAERILLRGLDAPEIHGRCPAEMQAARVARERLDELLAAGVTIERQGRDLYRRTLAHLRTREGALVSEILIREGYARAYTGRGRRQGWCKAPDR